MIVVPHSHNDAGWCQTFDQYFKNYTRYILDNVVTVLKEKPKMTFVWNDIAFLREWWQQAERDQKQECVLKLTLHNISIK